ncbi:F-box/LRR-repeat protein 4-like [Temnothorax nylanderi]|uniref:F-box/LRR-repeat protein 4-like n=1 Tax=Temnothorax nylanderi TaxID=102681 RepID=UPI003A8A2FCD
MLRLVFKKSLPETYTKIDAVMLIGTLDLILPRSPNKSLNEVLTNIHCVYSLYHENDNLTADLKNAHLDIIHLQENFPEYCTISKRDKETFRDVIPVQLLGQRYSRCLLLKSHSNNTQKLDLIECDRINDEGFSYLEKLKGLEHLNLYGTFIKTQHLFKILQKNERLRELNFEPGYHINTCTVAIELRNSCPDLEAIYLRMGDVTSQTIDILADCKNLRMVHLPPFIVGFSVGQDCLRRLLSSCQRLEVISVDSIILTDHDLKLLTQCKNLERLIVCRVTVGTPKKFSVILEHCSKLQELQLIFCNISDDLVNEWKERYPHVSVYTFDNPT